ncbi:cytochrome c [Candidatus Sulfurimonas marisnigri]|uniref:Cytochrome c n=1 Tax=Candidatus Sulfurimonas marisnigri TaxID=2740405 RepID=A0A7S7M2B7_9BACT|nr:cytochrome c [Candidatus Sulfurimonas marisnigri]QOY55821.1 cytochrome c [Candidatus Sulfurimonas marisnigri]
MRYILFLLMPFYLFAKSSFITPMEYASSLYKNPRGIGCHLCHGESGEGRLVATYMDKKIKKSFSGNAINSLDFGKFHKALNERKNGMPRYFLTKKEIQALYFYLQEKKKKSSSNEK